MGAAAATQKPPEHEVAPGEEIAVTLANEEDMSPGPRAGDAPESPSSRASSAAEAPSLGAPPSVRSGAGSRPTSGAATEQAEVKDQVIWKFAAGDPVPEAFMVVLPEGTDSEAVLAQIESDVCDPTAVSATSIESRLQRVHAIMEELDNDERLVLLEEESKQARELRVNVAKRLGQLREAHEKQQQRGELNRRKEMLYKKAQTVELILEKRQKQAQLKKDIERFEAKEVAAIAKLSELRSLLRAREDAHREACAQWEQKFDPVVEASLKHVAQAKEAVQNAASNSRGVSINKDITKELQSLLSKTLVKSSAELYAQRSALHSYRQDLERRLEALRAGNSSLLGQNKRPAASIIKLLHEPGDRLAKVSPEVDQRMRSNILDFKSRIRVIQEEADWLQANPATQAWKDLENELSSVTKRNEMKEKVENAHAFLASWMETKAMRTADEALTARAVIVKKIADEILDEVIKSFAAGVGENVSKLAEAADFGCAQAAAAAIAAGNHRALPASMGLVRGHLYALATGVFYRSGRQREVGAAPNLICSERNPIAIPPKEESARSRCSRELSLKKLLMHPQDTMAIDRLIEHERETLDDLTLSPTDGTVKLPGSAGELTLLRFLPRAAALQSLLVAGTSLGRFVVWAVPWSSGSDPEAPAPPQMVAYSPSLPMMEVSPLEDFKESPTSPNLVITLDKQSNVRVWTLNPPPKRGKHSSGAFSNNLKKFVPFVPACIFMLSPAELNLPLPPPIAHMHHNRRPMDPQAGVSPKTVCFHPSCNFAGRNQSIMVGTEGGDLYKINMDFKEPALVAPVLYIKPFVSMEYPLPMSGGAQIAEKDDDKGGNNVYREVFHFHKSPIIFLDVLFRSSNSIVSIDAAGTVATWSYKPEHFTGSGWFVPSSTTYLDLSFLSHEPLPNSGGSAGAQLSNYTEKIDCPPQYFLDTLKLWRRRRVFMPPGDSYAILETFFPVIESEQLELQYERITMVQDPSAQSSKDNSEAHVGDSPRSSYSNKSDTGDDSVLWMRQNMKRCLSGTTICDVCISEDGADIGILLSTMCYPRSSVYATALEAKLREQAAGEAGADDAPEACFVDLSLHGVIISIDSNDLTLHQSYIVFELDPGERVLSLSLGPLQSSMRTRIAIVKTNSRLRLFCTDTGIEVFPQSGSFPFWYPKPPGPTRKQKFPRSVSAMCPLFSMCAFGNNADSTVSVFSMHHTEAGGHGPPAGVPWSDAEKKKIRHRLRHVSKLTAMSARVSVANDVGSYIVNIIVESALDSVFDRTKKAKIIREMYGSEKNLGAVYPTTWPSEKREFIGDLAPKEAEFFIEDVAPEGGFSRDEIDQLSVSQEVEPADADENAAQNPIADEAPVVPVAGDEDELDAAEAADYTSQTLGDNAIDDAVSPQFDLHLDSNSGMDEPDGVVNAVEDEYAPSTQEMNMQHDDAGMLDADQREELDAGENEEPAPVEVDASEAESQSEEVAGRENDPDDVKVISKDLDVQPGEERTA